MVTSGLNPQLDMSKFRDIGIDVLISPFVDIRHPQLVSIGNHVAIDFGFVLSTEAKIGNYIHIGPHVSAIGGKGSQLILGDFCSIAAGVRIICRGDEHLGEGIVGALIPSKYKDRQIGEVIEVPRFAALGTNSIIMPGLKIGEGAVVGANSLLKTDAEPWTIYAGSPARPIRLRKKDKILNFAKEIGGSNE
jgi:acetyltransferase-like isoleucine patch superfamily enzyme